MVTFTTKRTETGTLLSVSSPLCTTLAFQEISLFKISFTLVSMPLIFIENYSIPSINATHFGHLQMLKYFWRIISFRAFRFWQRCQWGSNCSGIWSNIYWQMVPGSLEDIALYISRFQEATSSSKKLATLCQAARLRVPEDLDFHLMSFLVYIKTN